MADTEALVRTVLERTPARLRELTSGIDRELLVAPLDGGWSLSTLVSHLIDVEAVGMRQRIGRILHENTPFLPSVNPADDVAAELPPFSWLMDGFETARRDSLDWLAGLDFAAFDRQGQHAVAGLISARNVYHWWAIHDLAHIRQALTMLQSPLESHLDNMAAFLAEL